MAVPAELKDLLKKAKGITSNSKEVEEGFIFFAIKGSTFDGHDFVEEALERGALCAVVERELNLPKTLKVPSTREALGESAHLFFGKPSEKLKVVGITGTNGKTTTSYIVETILKTAGYKSGLLGTIQYRLGEEVLGSGRTTPDAITWHRTLAKILNKGGTHAVAEVSSHALDQLRVWGTVFEGVIFTNLSQDHLDYHGDMESYFKAKLSLFRDYKYRFAVINADDTYGRRILKEARGEVLAYGKEGELRILDFETGFEGSTIKLELRGKTYTFKSNLIGEFQAYNLSAGIGYAFMEGIDPDAISQALKKVSVPGRFEVHRSDRGFIAIVDYAHTPDAIDNVLRTARKLAKGRLITVFGAGGNRDRTKRPLMGKFAQKWSDIIILTSDNPRDEDPQAIIEDILRGIEDKNKVKVIPDRKEAIEVALSSAGEGDIVAVLGKGHEDYQEIKGVKYPFNDAQVIEEFLQRR